MIFIRSLCIPTLFILFMTGRAAAQTTLSGIVRDKDTGELLPGATVYFPDLKTGAATGPDGRYTIGNLPRRRFLVQVKFVGYRTHTETVDLNAVTAADFVLPPASIEAAEVVIIGSAFATDRHRSSIPVAAIDKIDLITTPSDNFVDAIVRTPGVSAVTSGNGIAKPVIRGLGYNRIVVISEGIRQEGQQWGDEHGLEIDPFSAERVEILKGPASLLYGSDALGGVVNILEPLPAPAGTVRGEAGARFATNNGLTANSLMLEGNRRGFVWRTRGSYRNAAPYRMPAERVYNTAFNGWSAEGFAGFNKRWGYSHLHASRWDTRLGLAEGERDSLTGSFVDAGGQIVPEDILSSRTLFLPNQHVTHTRISTVNSIYFGRSRIRANAGHQVNERREYETSPDVPGLSLDLSTATWDVKYYFPEVDSFETVVGVQGMHQQNRNRGTEYLIPDYALDDAGGFFAIRKTHRRLTLNAGARFDGRSVNGKSLEQDGKVRFEAFKNRFSAVAGSLGAAWQVDSSITLKANAGRGFRAPNISELSANGLHEGTFRYEVGNPGLSPETSLQFDLSLIAESNHMSVEVDAFYNLIDRFIYYRQDDGETQTIGGIDYPVFRYVQGDAVLYGGEVTLDFHPARALHIENSLALVHGTNRETDSPLPFIPATRIRNEIQYTFGKGNKVFSDLYVKAGVQTALAQNKYDDFETRTSAYALVHLGAGAGLHIGRQVATVFIEADNLLDQAYFDHLSRTKPLGIYNMGRNVAVGITLPFGVTRPGIRQP